MDARLIANKCIKSVPALKGLHRTALTGRRLCKRWGISAYALGRVRLELLRLR